MSRKEITSKLTKLLENHINPKQDTRIYTAKEVTLNYSGHKDTVRVDYMHYKPLNNTISGLEKGDFYCYEIKSSIEDFESGHGLNFVGDYNYIVTTEEVASVIARRLPHYVGIIVHDNWKYLYVKKKAKRYSREISTLEMLFCMFRSSNRELYKANKWNYCSMDMAKGTRRLPKEVINPLTLDYQEYICLCEFEGQRDIRTYKFGKNHWWHGPGVVDEYVIAWKDMPTQPSDI